MHRRAVPTRQHGIEHRPDWHKSLDPIELDKEEVYGNGADETFISRKRMRWRHLPRKEPRSRE